MSIRDILVTAIVLGVLPYALMHPYAGVLLWTWLSIMNPHKLAWGFAFNAPFAAMAAGVTLIGLLVTKDRVRLPIEPTVVTLIVFVCWTALTTATAIDPASSWVQLSKVLKIQLMTLVALAVLHEPRHLRLFVWVNALSLGFYGVKGGLFTFTTGGGNRVWGPPGGFIEGNNELALALVMAIPLMYYLFLTSPKKWVRYGLVAAMLLSVASVLGTHSRGALLAIGAMAVFLWWRAPNKLVATIPMVVLGLAMLAFMPENWFERMNTIREYQSDSSAMGRINAWWTAYHIANDRILGGGFEIYTPEVYRAYAPDPSVARAAHSIYFQVLGEHGWIGLAVFLAVWLFTWRAAAKVRRSSKGVEKLRDLFILAGMCQVSLVGYFVGGAFLSLAYFDLPYNIMVMLVVAKRLLAVSEQPSRQFAPRAIAPARVAPDRRSSSRQ